MIKRILIRLFQRLFKPVFILIHKQKLPHFRDDFDGPPTFMISELPGGEQQWTGVRKPGIRLGNNHPWSRYFNTPLQTRPVNLSDMERFLVPCRYLSDRKTRGRADYWEVPDIFEERKSGDCEDHSIWAWRQLHDLGIRARLILGRWKGWHAWIHIHVNGRVYLFDPTAKKRWFPNLSEYDPYWAVEKTGRMNFETFLFPGHGPEYDNGYPDLAD